MPKAGERTDYPDCERCEELTAELERYEAVAAALAASLKSHMGKNCGGCSAVKSLADYDALKES